MRSHVSREKTIAVVLAGCITLAVGLGGVSCVNSTEADPTPVRTFKITPAAQPRTVSAVNASPTAPSLAAPGVPGGSIDIVGRDTKFDVTDPSATAGAVTIRFDN